MATNGNKRFWDKKHLEKEELTSMSQHSAFVEQSMKYFPKGGRVLELGAGIGSDSIFLAGQEFKVVATDFSQSALDYISATASLKVQPLDLSNLFPFSNQEFDVVYANLALHYFNKQITQQIFDEISRVLKPGGTVATLLNCVTDSEYGLGEKIEDDYFYILGVGPKRYFSIESLKPFVSKFEIVILDDKGSDPRRNHKEGLIRFIGKKVA